MQSVHMTFVHNGSDWIARDEDLEVAAGSLSELDSKLREALRARYSPSSGTRLTVTMEFDYSTIPYWMTQYHPYYINRRLEFEY